MGEIGNSIVTILSRIPPGRVASYGQVAAMAGLRNGARTVARVLHSSSSSLGLPWWRVLRADGTIALPRGGGFEEQAALLAAEGIAVSRTGAVDLGRFAWDGRGG